MITVMSEIRFRRATDEDVPAVVALLADDRIGPTREDPGDLLPYRRAFARVDRDPGQFLVVGELNGSVVATAQLTFVPGLSRRGGTRALIEAVRVSRPLRGGGLGSAMMRWAIEECRTRGCHIVQLTSDLSRHDAHSFYLTLGFTRSHAGFSYRL